MPWVEAPRTLEAAIEVALAVGRSEIESGAPVGRQLPRPGAEPVGATACTAGVTPSVGRAVGSAARRSRGTKQRPPRSQVLPPKPATHTHTHTPYSALTACRLN